MKGLVVLVTGGSSGLGLACIQRFARQGARVVLCDLPSSKGNEVVSTWSSSVGQDTPKPSFFPADVTNEEQIQNMFNQVKQQYGQLNAVINCAGIGIAQRTYNINKVNSIRKQNLRQKLFVKYLARSTRLIRISTRFKCECCWNIQCYSLGVSFDGRQ